MQNISVNVNVINKKSDIAIDNSKLKINQVDIINLIEKLQKFNFQNFCRNQFGSRKAIIPMAEYHKNDTSHNALILKALGFNNVKPYFVFIDGKYHYYFNSTGYKYNPVEMQKDILSDSVLTESQLQSIKDWNSAIKKTLYKAQFSVKSWNGVAEILSLIGCKDEIIINDALKKLCSSLSETYNSEFSDLCSVEKMAKTFADTFNLKVNSKLDYALQSKTTILEKQITNKISLNEHEHRLLKLLISFRF